MSAPNLYEAMMKGIRSKHERGNAIRYFKLPMILLDSRLYGGAISQFYLLTLTMEAELDKKVAEGSEIITLLMDGLKLNKIAPGYEMDLKQLFGSDDWMTQVEKTKSSATENYISLIKNASEVELCSIAFILYGALVVGGGKSTQRKAKKVIKNCDHALFDISDNMLQTRKNFKHTFQDLGEKYCHRFDEFVSNAQRFMGKNNEVVLSIRCLPHWWVRVAGIIGTLAVGIVVAKRRYN